jgi:hypothetical protein
MRYRKVTQESCDNVIDLQFIENETMRKTDDELVEEGEAKISDEEMPNKEHKGGPAAAANAAATAMKRSKRTKTTAATSSN